VKSRLETILETVQSILSEVVDTPQRKEQLLKAAKKAMKRADRRTLQLARQGYGVGENPPEHEFIRQNDARYERMKSLVGRLEGMNEDIRHPDQVRADMDYHIEKRGGIPKQLHDELKQSMIAYGELPPEKKKRPKKETQNPTNESVLKELYSFAGLYARAAGIKPRELTDKEKEEGQNPWLTPEGKTIYPTGTLARILGGNEYVQRGTKSVPELNQQFTDLNKSTRNVLYKATTGSVRGLQTPKEIEDFSNPRIFQMGSILRKMASRASRVRQVGERTLGLLRAIQPPPPPPTDHYG